jgi:uncharacterized protein YuzE
VLRLAATGRPEQAVEERRVVGQIGFDTDDHGDVVGVQATERARFAGLQPRPGIRQPAKQEVDVTFAVLSTPAPPRAACCWH